MELLLSLMCRRLLCHQAGVVALIPMVLQLSMCRHLCSLGIFAIVAILLLPLTQWRCCRLQAGVVALVTMASLPSSMRRRLCHCHNDVAALVALVPSPTLHGHCCLCCTGVVILIALTSLLSHCMGIVTIVAPVLLPQLSCCVCTIALVLLPLSRWHCCPWCADIITLIAQASLPLLCLHCAVDLQVPSPSLSWHLLSRGQHGGPHRRKQQHQPNKGNNASTTRAVMPAQ